MRFDAEFYSQELLSAIDKVTHVDFDFMRNIANIKSGTTPRERSEHLKEGAVLLKTTNIRDNVLCYTHPDDFFFIDNKTNNRMNSTKLKAKDVLLNIVGATTDVIGRTAIVFDDFPKANITQAMAFCRIQDDKFSAEYVFVFLICYYGKTQTKYIARPTGQYNLNLQEVGFIRIPLLSYSFQSAIRKLVCLTKENKSKAYGLYSEASRIILEEINLPSWKPKHSLSFVKNYSYTKFADRIDAEYYQPKYEEIEEAIKSYTGGFSLIKDEFKQNKSTFKVDNKKTYQYIEIGSVNVSTGEVTANDVLGVDLPANAKRVFKKGDVVVSKVRTYRGAIAIIEQNGFVGSGAFTVLRESGRINKETLLTFLHSKPLLAWSLKPNTGTSYPVIVDDDILNLPVPLLSEEKQNQIQQKVTESFNLRKQSKHLLECAKRAVEMAIEQDEQTATDWLTEQEKAYAE